MAARVEQGFLVLADLSGFTEFVSTTELEHGPQITAGLLETVMKRIAPPFEVQEVEGDAVFAVGPDAAIVRPTTVLDVLEGAYVAFRKQQRDMQIATTCTCNACRSIPMLNLKLVVHHGSYLRQSVGGRAQLAGPDVILVHRLLKNSVEGSRAYELLSEAAGRRIGIAGSETMRPHVERYEHLGDVRCLVGDLEPVWRRSLEANVVRVSPEEAAFRIDVGLPVPPHAAWDWILSPEKKREWGQGIEKVVQESARQGVGTVSHCHHTDGSAVSIVILDWRPFEYFTCEYQIGDMRVWDTTAFSADADGCRVTSLWAPSPRLPDLAVQTRGAIESMVPMMKEDYARLEAAVRALAG